MTSTKHVFNLTCEKSNVWRWQEKMVGLDRGLVLMLISVYGRTLLYYNVSGRRHICV